MCVCVRLTCQKRLPNNSCCQRARACACVTDLGRFYLCIVHVSDVTVSYTICVIMNEQEDHIIQGESWIIEKV